MMKISTVFLVSKVLEKALDSNEFYDKCLSIISSNPNLIKKLEGVHKERFESILEKGLESMHYGEISTKMTHPSVILRRAIDKLGFDYIRQSYPEHLEVIIDKLPLRPGVMDFAKKDKDFKKRLISNIKSKAGSYSFDTANSFVDRLYDVEEKITEFFSDSDCLELICEIIDAAGNGAWRSSEVVESKFSGLKVLKAKVLSYLNNSDEAALAVLKNKIDDSITCETFKSRYLVSTEQPSQENVKTEAD
ncbi:hypothetical protein [Pseudoalteromonas piscicida]|uniref:hypothetical protein n=1 Tax=Pseudoalteromonas piscicida TaxID=43662 RepID=UPI0032C12A00